MSITRMLAVGIVVFFSGCALNPYRDKSIDSSVDPTADFTGYTTYSWFDSSSIVHDTFGRWEPPGFDADQEIRLMIDTQMHRHNMIFSDTDADVLVAYAAGIDMDALWGSVDADDTLTVLGNVPAGALLVSLIDADTGEAVWASHALAKVKGNQSDKRIKKRLAHTIRRMFRDLPK